MGVVFVILQGFLFVIVIYVLLLKFNNVVWDESGEV